MSDNNDNAKKSNLERLNEVLAFDATGKPNPTKEIFQKIAEKKQRERADLAFAEGEKMFTKAIEIAQLMKKSEREFNNLMAKNDKELGKLMAMIDRFAAGKPIEEEDLEPAS
jgi:mevalonate kinase